MGYIKWTKWVADFETTVYKNQTFTEVWAAGLCELETEHCYIVNSLEKWLHIVFNMKQNMKIWFHNLKFDGSFILDFLLKNGYKQAFLKDAKGHEYFKDDKKLRHKEFSYLISDKGVFYLITIRWKKFLIKIYDSFKLIPFSLSQAGKAFDVKHKKLDFDEYTGKRYAGWEITEKEREYLKNDLLCLKECLEYMFDKGHNKMTIGSNCMSDFKKDYDKQLWNAMFPQLYDEKLDENVYGKPTVGHYINKSYRGAWCYVKEDIAGKIQFNGCTVDANSLYPSVMLKNKFPIGHPTFFGKEIPDFKNKDELYFFVRFKCRFKLKENHLPFIQIKYDLRYDGREMLKDNLVREKKTGRIIENPLITFTMTETDFYRFFDFYEVSDFEILDGCYFKAVFHLFDRYIGFYGEQKRTATDPALRTLAKLFLNNLYGKFATYIDSSFKVCVLKDDKITFRTVTEMEKDGGYIAIGSAITSYARDETIRLAQKNIKYFCYADTDSLHCNCSEDELIDIPIHDTDFGFWKVENHWCRGLFHRPKSYVETVLDDAGIEQYFVTCAGMGKKAKEIFKLSLMERDGTIEEDTGFNFKEFSFEEMSYIRQGHILTDFTGGLLVQGNLKAKRIIGGIVLEEQEFILRK